jgi:hypothetical protein
MHQAAVIYLSWLPYGVDELKGFLQSYNQYTAGQPHRLVLLFNGVQSESELEPFLKTARDLLMTPYDVMVLPSGQDIDAYFYAARKREEQYLLFLNTYSRFLADNWLTFYIRAVEQPSVGAVAATASAMSYYSAVFQQNTWKWEHDKSLYVQFRKYKLLLKAFFYWRLLFPSFPNYHLRTNAFMMPRSLFLEIKCPVIRSKFHAYQFESGYQSLTRQLLKKNKSITIIDRSGETHPLYETGKFPIFWKGNQEGLLISDNQTQKYDASNGQEKSFLSFLAWGKHSSP